MGGLMKHDWESRGRGGPVGSLMTGEMEDVKENTSVLLSSIILIGTFNTYGGGMVLFQAILYEVGVFLDGH